MCVYTHNPTTSTSKTLYEFYVLLGNYTTYRGNSLPIPKEGTESLSRKFSRNYHNRPRDFPEEHRYSLLRGGSLKSWKRCVSAQYAPRTHLATLVANTALFTQDPVGLVRLFVSDFSILAIEAFGGFKIFIEFSFLQQTVTFYSALAVWISSIPINETVTCMQSHPMDFALRDGMRRRLVII